MENSISIFSSASIALPPYDAEDKRWSQWAMIACDQFTSEPDYWKAAEAFRGTSPSTLDLFLPEAYLGTETEYSRRAQIAESMHQMESWLHPMDDTMIYVERKIPDGRIRRGLVGKIDLEAYSYQSGSRSAIRATEATVLSRIPPRVSIRAQARYELPHVMLLMDDTAGLMDFLTAQRDQYVCAYDFDLMQGGGHVAGYRISGQALAEVECRIAGYESSLRDDLVYAVGDGNHSLAAAKAHYENLKKTLGNAAATHPARYALVELMAIQDSALDFEPIYRIVTGCDPADLLEALSKVTTAGSDGQTVAVLYGEHRKELSFDAPTHALTVGTLQDFLDEYVSGHSEAQCDYIHDESSLFALSKQPNTVGFLMEGMKKESLFPYVRQHGVLPRKTFSMGEARSKRYYIEARKIVPASQAE